MATTTLEQVTGVRNVSFDVLYEVRKQLEYENNGSEWVIKHKLRRNGDWIEK